jgi:hypothetical protein
MRDASCCILTTLPRRGVALHRQADSVCLLSPGRQRPQSATDSNAVAPARQVAFRSEVGG